MFWAQSATTDHIKAENKPSSISLFNTNHNISTARLFHIEKHKHRHDIPTEPQYFYSTVKTFLHTKFTSTHLEQDEEEEDCDDDGDEQEQEEDIRMRSHWSSFSLALLRNRLVTFRLMFAHKTKCARNED